MDRALTASNVHVPTLGWRMILSLGGRDNPVAARLRHVQLTEITRAYPLFAIVLTLHALAVTGQLASTPFANVARWWFLAHTLGLVGFAIAVLRNRRAPFNPRKSIGRMHRIAAGSVLLSLSWNGLIVTVLPVCTLSQVIVLSLVQMALIASGAFALSGAPLAALLTVTIFVAAHAFVAVLTVPHGTPAGVVLVLIGAVGAAVFRGILSHACSLAQQVAAAEALRDRGEVIALLLGEYERNGVDWLWETDAEGRLVHISPKFVEVTGYSLDHFIGYTIEHFAAQALSALGEDVAAADNQALLSALAERKRFRNLYLHTLARGEDRWWCLSATPRLDAQGRFAGFTGIGSDLTEQRRARAEIERLASSDCLTGLANRETLRGQIQAALDAVRAGGTGACAVMLIDLDRFKDVNDTLGHQVGDDLLCEAAQRLKTELKHGGTVARLGGDEFAVVLSGVNAAAARAIAVRLIDALGTPYQLRGSDVCVGASIGVAMGPDDGDTVTDILRAADLALYRAKDDGRGVVRIYEPTLHADAEARRTLETALRGALAAGELSLVFQPIVDLGNLGVAGFEALLRWKNPRLGPVSPAVFIPVAEELGLMDSIGEWVLRCACAEAAQWPAHVQLSVNLSPSQLVNARLPGIVLNALATNGIAPDRLELEVTENIFLNESDGVRGALAQLSALGIRIGLDDFGTGYSSLGYLRTTVFDTIKIDRCFVREAVDSSSQSAAIVRHIVGLAASLGMETVAEGAETQEELDAVRNLGCARVQGYFTGRPMLSEAALALVRPPVLEARAA